jgi:type IV secretion system protein TrbL
MGSAARTAFTLGQEASGSSSLAAGMRGVATAASSATRSRVSSALGLGEAGEAGRQGAFNAMAGRTPSAARDAGADPRDVPGWARAMKAQATARHHRQAAGHALAQGDRGGAAATPDIKERDD